MLRSITIKSGYRVRASSRASLPVVARPTTASLASASKNLSTIPWKMGLSSTMSTRMSDMAGQIPDLGGPRGQARCLPQGDRAVDVERLEPIRFHFISSRPSRLRLPAGTIVKGTRSSPNVAGRDFAIGSGVRGPRSPPAGPNRLCLRDLPTVTASGRSTLPW